MPVSTSTDESHALTIFTVEGELTFEEQMNALKAFYSGDPTANVLWDFRLMKGNRVSSQELEELFNFIKANRAKRLQGKTALVATSDLDFGLSRVSEAYSQIRQLPWEMKAFRTMDEALEWIDRDN
ncbi:hypothetical protein DSCW_43810 [Desulfosarcina widdelii]|uniref:STAS/SEC14 domain-containing protein n=1 Tax=Desulfosarcina widdelii TaxID=947919 RepID=A0A5K7ZEY4_9BACT|nr:STAS/SEC14 domain-containing protein [Desulfosarcina widdelii]BBO76964.1 hypothetical protein DSCW_43810 [Desulfosarcina widdelii]